MLVVEHNILSWVWVVEIWNIAFNSQDDVLWICWFLCSMLFQFVSPKKVWKLYTLVELYVKSPCLWTWFQPSYPLFQCSPQSKGIFIRWIFIRSEYENAETLLGYNNCKGRNKSPWKKLKKLLDRKVPSFANQFQQLLYWKGKM